MNRRDFLLMLGTAAIALDKARADDSGLFFLDTDLDSDVDDVAMLAMLLGMIGDGQLIGATVASNVGTVAPCMRALLDHAGQASVPVGAYQGSTIGGGAKSLYATTIRDEFRPGDTRANYPDAIAVMRNALSAVPDHSVTIITGGTLTNVSALLRADAGLVIAKCSKIVTMGGNFTDSNAIEHNISFDTAAANHVAANSPIPVFWAGSEVGGSIFTKIEGSGPFGRAWELTTSIQTAGKRQSWDLMAALFAVRGNDDLLATNGPCDVTFSEDGRTSYQPNTSGRNYYLSKDASDEMIAAACQMFLDKVATTEG